MNIKAWSMALLVAAFAVFGLAVAPAMAQEDTWSVTFAWDSGYVDTDNLIIPLERFDKVTVDCDKGYSGEVTDYYVTELLAPEWGYGDDRCEVRVWNEKYNPPRGISQPSPDFAVVQVTVPKPLAQPKPPVNVRATVEPGGGQ